MNTPNIVPLAKAKRHDLQQLVNEVKEVLYTRQGGRTVNFVEALGVLEFVKMDLYREVLEE